MIGCLVWWKWAVACLPFDLSQQPTCPQVMHSRRWTQVPPVLRQSSQPSALAVTSWSWSRWVHSGIGFRPAYDGPRNRRQSSSAMTGVLFVLSTTFLASSVEAIEMVTIVLGVGATRGWRATLVGTVAG